MVRRFVAGVALLGLVLGLASTQGQDTARSRVYLGITVEPRDDGADPAGVRVQSVTPDSPAAKAGLKAGDVIEKVGDQAVRDFDGLLAQLAKHKPGEQLTFQVKRGDAEQQLTVTLAERQARAEPRPRERTGGFLGVQTRADDAGTGALIGDVMPDSPAAKAGLKAGDVIVSVDGKAVSGPEELRAAVQRAGAGKEVKVTVRRGDEQREFTARLDEAPVDGLAFPPLPFPPPGGTGIRAIVPGVLEAAEKVRELERRVKDLEKRLSELERKSGAPSK
jgi:S1-C subfamily serine protease